jgi:hypothetical protein
MPSGLTKMMFRAEAFDVRGSRFEVESEADGTFEVRRSTFEVESEADGTFDVRRSTFEVEPEADGTFDVRRSTFEVESETCESLVFNIGPRTSLSHSHSTSNLEPLRVFLLNLERRTSNLFKSFSSTPNSEPQT